MSSAKVILIRLNNIWHRQDIWEIMSLVSAQNVKLKQTEKDISLLWVSRHVTAELGLWGKCKYNTDILVGAQALVKVLDIQYYFCTYSFTVAVCPSLFLHNMMGLTEKVIYRWLMCCSHTFICRNTYEWTLSSVYFHFFIATHNVLLLFFFFLQNMTLKVKDAESVVLSENRLVPEVRHSCDIVLFLNIDLMFLSQTFST